MPCVVLYAFRSADGVALAQQFHHFYNACRIKDAEPAVRDARLTLCLAAKQTIGNVLKLIGVESAARCAG